MPRVYKKKPYARRYRQFRAKTVYKGSKMVSRTPLMQSLAVHRFKETCQIGSISAAGSSDQGGRIMFQISDLNNWTSFKSLFDLYKITGVRVKLVPKWSMSSADVSNSLGTAGNLPMLYIAQNRDPYVPAPGNIGDILNDDGCKIIRVTKPITLYVPSPKPDITNAGGNIPFQFGTGKKWQPWLTTGGNSQTVNQENVSHYGLRWWLANGNGSHEVDLDVYLTYYFTMKEQD